ncbi:hypothetical protein B0H12DRAFT_126033 [Mycena haematopus]|nr:hypothetical protein B0H12DRAFT_126033 [Mycena haematopus]
MPVHSIPAVFAARKALPNRPNTIAVSQDDQEEVCPPNVQAERTVHDAISTRNILLTHFPLELVYIILDHAEYWPQVTVARKEEVAVAASAVFRANASLEYLETLPIIERGPEDVRLKVARVEFTIVSHDQGWCDEPGLKGTYDGYTWFAAAILRPNEVDPSVTHEVPNPTAANGSTRWDVQRNHCASSEYRRHVVVWDEVGNVPKATGAGAGTGEGFIACLAPGDRIFVIARALCPGRVNWIQSAQVSVYYRLA